MLAERSLDRVTQWPNQRWSQRRLLAEKVSGWREPPAAWLSFWSRLMRTTTILASLAGALAVVIMLSAAAEKETFNVTITPNSKLDASFHRKEKTKDRGWKVFIKFTNKTDKPIRSIGTDYQLREGSWIISGSRTQTANSSPLLLPRQSAVFGWIDGVPSSVDSIHISEVEIE